MKENLLMKKLISIFTILVAPVVLYIACNPCRCPPVNEKYYKINSLAVTPFGSGNVAVDRGIPVSVDTMNLSYIVSTGCTANHSANPFNSLVNAAYACSCASCGDFGMKEKIKIMQITSDAAYSSNLPANSSLNSVFLVKKFNVITPFNRVRLDSIVTLVNDNYSLRDDLILFATQKPTASGTHRFKLTIEMESGQKFEAVTAPITWL